MHCGSTSINRCGADAGPIVPKNAFRKSANAATNASVELDCPVSPLPTTTVGTAPGMSAICFLVIFLPAASHDTGDQPLLVRCHVKHLELARCAQRGRTVHARRRDQ